MSSFSRRQNYSGHAAPITVREDAPTALREGLVAIASEAGLANLKNQRRIICKVLRVMPDPNNWNTYPYIETEVYSLLRTCDWYKVYDVAEAFYETIDHNDLDGFDGHADHFETELNILFRENGIGWQMKSGRIQYRGDEHFERELGAAIKVAQASGRETALNEFTEARKDLSRRPHADITGAIQHAMAGLECLSRDVFDSKDTLGKLIEREGSKHGVHPALRKTISNAFGYASNEGRHLMESKDPGYNEAELIVTLSAAAAVYLNRTFGEPSVDENSEFCPF